MSGKHKNGLITSNVCDACHNKAPATWKPIAKFDHAQIQPTTACASYHDGTGALALNGKDSARHIPATLACDACHSSTTVWTGAKVNHGTLTATCVTCHTGALIGAGGKSGKHSLGLGTTDACDKCHNVSPVGLARDKTFDHTQIQPATACAICHDGTGKLAKKQRVDARGDQLAMRHLSFDLGLDPGWSGPQPDHD